MRYRTWHARCFIGGTPVALTALPTRSLSVEARATATIEVATVPADAVGQVACVDVQIDRVWRRFFTGIVAPYTLTVGAERQQLTLVDVIDTRDVADTPITFDKTAYATGLRQIATRCQLTNDLLDAIADPLAGYDPAVYSNATYVLGDKGPVVIADRDALWSVLEEILRFGGLRLNVLPTGHAVAELATLVPRDTAVTVYATDPGTGEYGVIACGTTVDTVTRPLMSYFASGPTPGDGSSNTARATRGGGAPIISESFRFAEWAWACKLIADRELARRARDAVTYWFEAPVNLDIIAGITIGFRDDLHLGTNGIVHGVVTEVVTTDQANMRVTLTTGPSLLSGNDQTFGDQNAHLPIVDVVAMVLRHEIEGDETNIVDLTGQAISLVGAAITGYAWQVPPYEVILAPGCALVFASLTALDVVCMAADASEGNNAVTRRATTRLTIRARRTLSLARPSGWHAWRDGTWRSHTTHTSACTAVLSDQDETTGYALAGYADGSLWITDNWLTTTPTQIASLSGAVTAIAVVPWDTRSVLVGHGAVVSLVRLPGGAATSLGTLASPIRAISVHPTSGAIRVCAGTALYAGTPGQLWVTRHTSSLSVLAVVDDPATRHTVVLRETATAADAIRVIERPAATVRWTDLDSDDRPGTLRSLAVVTSGTDLIVSECSQVIPDALYRHVWHTSGAGRLWRLVWDGTDYVPSLVVSVAGTGLGVVTLPNEWHEVNDTAPTMFTCGPITPYEEPAS